MDKKYKELLLKDICARLPYEVKVQYKDDIFTIDYISGIYEEIKLDTPDRYTIDISEVKPYLFPMSSMTEEQKKYISNKWGINEEFDFEIDPNWGEYFVELGYTVEFIDWLNKNHFDYRGLIDKSLALDATGLNIYN